MPRAYIEMILSSKPGQRRWSLAISCGSNVPCRSRGTSISTFPVPVSTVLRPEPLRVLPSAPSPRGWSISAFNARSASARFRSSSRPFGSRAAFGSAPPSSSSSRASEIRGALRRAMGNLLSSHYARPYTECLTLPPVRRPSPASPDQVLILRERTQQLRRWGRGWRCGPTGQSRNMSPVQHPLTPSKVLGMSGDLGAGMEHLHLTLADPHCDAGSPQPPRDAVAIGVDLHRAVVVNDANQL